MGVDTYTDLKAHVLERALEASDGTSEFADLVDDAILLSWRELVRRWPWKELVKNPPGAGVTTDDLTSLTIEIASAGAGVTGTLSSTVSSSMTGRKIRPSGTDWSARITSHSGGSASVTLDAAPEAVDAGTSVIIFQDEYDLAEDLGIFIDGIWWQDGHFVELVDEEWLKRRYPDPPEAARVPHYFARLTERRIRFSEYPNAVQRFEYPYVYVPDDPSGSGTLGIGEHLRHALAQMSLSLLYEMKLDRRERDAKARAEELVERAIAYERRRTTGFAQYVSKGSGRYGN